MQDAFIDLDLALLEAEILWGKSIRENVQPLQQCATTLSATIRRYLSSLDKQEPFNEEWENKKMGIMYEITDGSRSNPFSDEITKAVIQ